MAMSLSILYRGPLSSCNYGCDYCPFAKHHETATELARDRRALERFTDWVASRRVATTGSPSCSLPGARRSPAAGIATRWSA